jgi:hypothetical protein
LCVVKKVGRTLQVLFTMNYLAGYVRN